MKNKRFVRCSVCGTWKIDNFVERKQIYEKFDKGEQINKVILFVKTK